MGVDGLALGMGRAYQGKVGLSATRTAKAVAAKTATKQPTPSWAVFATIS